MSRATPGWLFSEASVLRVFPIATAIPARRPGGFRENADLRPRRSRRMRFDFEHTGLRATDLNATLRFFAEGLGMRVVGRSRVEETGGEVVVLASRDGGPKIELNGYPPGSRHATKYAPGEALDPLGFGVREGRPPEAIRPLQRFGGKLREEESASLAHVDSPDGHTVEPWETPSGVTSPARAPEASPRGPRA
jgi:catechol 2,3-dioxygenase-like lactoylglutathione lyase family enzyme